MPTTTSNAIASKKFRLFDKRSVNKPRTINGHIDQFNCGMVAKWAWSPDTPDENIGVAINANRGGLLENAVADVFRADFKEAHIGTGHHGFQISVTNFE